jgi:erythromycin esterase
MSFSQEKASRVARNQPHGSCRSHHVFSSIILPLARSLVSVALVFAPTNVRSSNDDVIKESTEWFRSAAVPLSTTDPTEKLDDLEPLRSMVGNAQIVAVGEATHGTREFFRLKHRILEFLVEKMNFTVFAIEANWPESLAVNDYVLNGKGDPAQALAGLYFWTWNTEEVLDMIRWMRMYNEDASHPKKVKFFGFDMQVARVAVTNVEDYLRKVDPEEAALVTEVMAPLSDAAKEYEYANQPAEFRNKTAAAIDATLNHFDDRREQYLRSSSSEAWILARHNLEIVKQAEKLRSAAGAGDYAVRDPAMAENIKWILGHEPPGTKVMVWAHNGHISTEPIFGSPSMGMTLRGIYGSAMVVCGFSLNQRSFQAKDMHSQDKKLRTFTVGPASADTLDSALAATGLPLFAVDLRRAPTEGPVAAWLNRPQKMRSIGAMFKDTAPQAWLMQVRPLSFDVLLFVNLTTAARENRQEQDLEFSGG